MPVVDRRTPIDIGSRGTTNRESEANHIEIRNLTKAEYDAIEAFVLGQTYLRVINGRLHAYSVHEPLPDAERHPLLADHWEPGEIKMMGGPKSSEGWHSPGVVLSALGAGAREKDAYANGAKKLTRWGFHCMRSPKGADGRHWESWILPYMLAADHELKDAIQGITDWHESAEAVCQFIVDQRIPFGSLDITIQRWALSNPD